MLHENPLMADIDVNQWRNLQSLLLESAKAKRRIILIHEDGLVEKLVHSTGEDVADRVDRVDDPHAVARQLYEANRDKVDFVAVFERRAFDAYFGAFQATWQADEDLDAFVHRTYAMLDDYADGLVTYPGKARDTLGLQWRTGATYEQVAAAVERFVTPSSSVVLGVLAGDDLWASLVLHFDADRRADVVTTVDPSRLTQAASRDELIDAAVSWVDATYGASSLGVFTDLEGAHQLLKTSDKLEALRTLQRAGRAWVRPVPESLGSLLATKGL